MPAVDVEGLLVYFPFEPYPTQLAYMQSVVRALNGPCNALLESPTGTGKTLCLLCSCLAWVLSKKTLRKGLSVASSPPAGASYKIVYCSRTHAQLTQVIRELKRSEYRDKVSMALLGAREHMCVNSEVSRLPSSQAQQSLCRSLRANKSCRFFRGLQQEASRAALLEESHIHDMEDLVVVGRRNGFCPYFFEREMAVEADIIFMPYNYVLDPSLRKQLPFELRNAVLIVDEAHNLPSVMSAAGCHSLQPVELANAIHDCSRAVAMQRLLREKENADATAEAMREQQFASLKILLCRLEECIAAERGENNARTVKSAAAAPIDGEVVRPGQYMETFLAKAQLPLDLLEEVNEVMTGAITALAQSDRPATGIGTVQKFLSSVFASAADESTRFVIQESRDAKRGTVKRSLGFWRLDNAEELQELSGMLHSMLLTSGTLSPIDHFAVELGVPFEVRLRGSHVIQPDQVMGCVACKGPTGDRLNSSYAMRNSIDYCLGLGMTLLNLTRNTPGGTLVFFPSYAALHAAVDLWRAGTGRPAESKTIYGMLTEMKPVFVEPSDNGALKAVVTSFQQAVDGSPKKGAILLGVCRGKISEGIDFADNHGRCVIVTGIPFANHTDLFVRLKREYLTAVAPHRPKIDGMLFTGNHWYNNEAMRAVTQCIGRVIRHKDDFGAIVLADERFVDHLGSLSEWVARRTTVHREFRETYQAIAQFFSSRSVTASAATNHIPYVELRPAFTDVHTSVPQSATKAKEFALAQENGSREHLQALQRRRIEAASELPQFAAAVVPTRSAVAAPQATSSGVGERPPIPAMQRHVFVDLPSHNCPMIGPTSRDFCLFLKERISAENYDTFRTSLKEIAELRGLLPTDKAAVRRRFPPIVAQLRSIFEEADIHHLDDILRHFGRHIPEEFRSLYAHLSGNSGAS